MRVPTVHLNGTSGEQLRLELKLAIEAIQAAKKALGDAMPNGRDYYVQGPDAIAEAMQEHRMRYCKLEGIEAELMAMHRATQVKRVPQ